MAEGWGLFFAAIASLSALGSVIIGYKAVRFTSEERKAREYSQRPYLTMATASIGKTKSNKLHFSQRISNRGVHPAVDIDTRFIAFDASSSDVLLDYQEAFSNEVVSGIDHDLGDTIPVDFDARPLILAFMGLKYSDAVNKQFYTSRIYFKIGAGSDAGVHHPEKPELEEVKKRAYKLASDYF